MFVRALTWVRRRKIELAVFVVGVLLRLSMIWNYHFTWNYDSDLHWELIQWIVQHGTVPHTESTFESFHPPLYYAIAAFLVNHGFTRAALISFSLACGIARLIVIWIGLELYLPGWRWARVAALSLAACTSASVHLDGMIYTESLNCLLNALVMLLLPLAFGRRGRFRWPLTLTVGAVCGLALLTKISTVAVLGAIGLAVAVEFFLTDDPPAERLRNLTPWIGMLAVLAVTCGWYYASNVRQYGKPFVSSFDLPSQRWLVEQEQRRHPLDRRSLGFLFGWDSTIYKNPYRPAGLVDGSRFFPVAIASSVVDYWGFGFAGYGDGGAMRPIADVRNVSRAAAVGGTVMFLAMLVAWFGALVVLLRYRDVGRLALLFVPLFMTAAMVHFATSCPVDEYGVTKGVYMTFGAPPLYALYGLAVEWSHRRPTRWPVLVLLLLSLWSVVAYSVFCRLGVKILPIQMGGT